jgi:hypothetical protein
MTAHVFVDETKQHRRLAMVAAVVAPADLREVRAAVRSLAKPGQRRVHFTSESSRRRNEILGTITELGLTATVYACERGAPELDSRRSCLTRIVEDHATAHRLIVERDDSLVAHDRRFLYDAVRKTSAGLTYEHMRPHEECLLWVPDALAWCWSAGGEWGRRVRGMLAEVDLGP